VANERRPINEREEAILDRLLSDDETLAQLRTQVPQLVVIARCACGCPTVEFEHPRVAPDVVSRPLNIEGRASGGASEAPIDILVFETGGYLSGLELVSYGAHAPQEWPTLDSIVPVRRA
jgi:hypothetical protein